MSGKRCQVCDGPIVNGRCKLCGMPYRNDETMYHLNENRRDHYRHSSAKVRAAMRQQEVPLGDRPARAQGSARATGADRKRTGSTGTQQRTYRSVQRTFVKGAQKSNNQSAQRPGGTDIQRGAGAYTYQRTEPPKKERRRIRWGMIVLSLMLVSFMPAIVELVENVVFELREDPYSHSGETQAMFLLQQGESFTVGEDLLMPGTYNIYADAGDVELQVRSSQGKKVYGITTEYSISLTFQEGDELEVLFAEDENAAILLEFAYGIPEI